jgi:hypothetical protein
MNWKAACKHWYAQFLLWRSAYNEIADTYMIAESWSGGNAVTFWYSNKDS